MNFLRTEDLGLLGFQQQISGVRCSRPTNCTTARASSQSILISHLQSFHRFLTYLYFLSVDPATAAASGSFGQLQKEEEASTTFIGKSGKRFRCKKAENSSQQISFLFGLPIKVQVLVLYPTKKNNLFPGVFCNAEYNSLF